MNTIEEIINKKRQELCVTCKNRNNDKDLCDIRVNSKNEANCLNYEHCMKNKCKTCKNNEKCNM